MLQFQCQPYRWRQQHHPKRYSTKKKTHVFSSRASNMAPARKLKRVAASQPGFLSLKSSSNPADLGSTRRKRVNKNKKKNWNKQCDINDVESFLEDVRHQERTTGWVHLSLAVCLLCDNVMCLKFEPKLKIKLPYIWWTVVQVIILMCLASIVVPLRLTYPKVSYR